MILHPVHRTSRIFREARCKMPRTPFFFDSNQSVTAACGCRRELTGAAVGCAWSLGTTGRLPRVRTLKQWSRDYPMQTFATKKLKLSSPGRSLSRLAQMDNRKMQLPSFCPRSFDRTVMASEL